MADVSRETSPCLRGTTARPDPHRQAGQPPCTGAGKGLRGIILQHSPRQGATGQGVPPMALANEPIRSIVLLHVHPLMPAQFEGSLLGFWAGRFAGGLQAAGLRKGGHACDTPQIHGIHRARGDDYQGTLLF